LKDQKTSKHSPIGIFDSGVGGLTVFREIRKVLPNEDLIYLGDTARVPYGSKSKDVIKRYSKQNAEFLLSKNVSMIVVACNTASAVSVQYLRELFPEINIVGVIEPVVDYIKMLSVKKIAVLGTNTTIESGAYQKALLEKKDFEIFSQPCPLFVPLVEEGLFNEPITLVAIEMYLSELKKANMDAVILGCTHYPMMKKQIKKYFGERTLVFDTAYHTALRVAGLRKERGKISLDQKGNEVFYVTDSVASFKKTAEMFLGYGISNIHHI